MVDDHQKIENYYYTLFPCRVNKYFELILVYIVCEKFILFSHKRNIFRSMVYFQLYFWNLIVLNFYLFII